MKSMKKLLIATALGVASCASLAAPHQENTVRIAAPFEIKGADPALSGDILLRMDVVETLVEVDAHAEPIPALAASWQVSDDGLHWQFVLRDNVRFHDGSPLNAQAVVKSLNAARSKEGLLDKTPISDISGEGQVVTIRLREPFTPLLSVLAESRSQILALSSWDQQGNITQIIGSGPFMLMAFQPPQSLAVKRFEDYWGKKPQIAAASYLSSGRAETRALLADSCDADYVFNLDAASRQRLARKPGLQIPAIPVPRTLMLKLNLGDPLLAELPVREAISMAIDRNAMAMAVLRYPGAATQLFPQNMGEWHNAALQPLQYQPERAAQRLKEAGWQAGSDGVLTRNGQRLSVTLLTFPDRPELPLMAMVIQQQLRKVGIEVKINSTNASEIPAQHHSGQLQMALFSRNFALTPDPTGTLLQDYAENGGDWGAMNWHPTGFSAALHTLTQSTDAAARAQARALITTALQQDLPVIPIAWYQQSAAINSQLKDVALDPFERHFGLRNMHWEP
ncbi:ABC transporter substrate-binding protein [Pantoea sp. EA-12]|uniref:ABC transporter substrate-binding protein n=1 Tax=Pantoea sp. EA-12 TaxID=3043303 RepID=UPI0024B5911F|nr:ABC transporter substrate-binding protein [Pantoea sp. EA-12]MDI9219560.1 ABC transporter substrate-binding protein [Pantoea sp. EA-12]